MFGLVPTWLWVALGAVATGVTFKVITTPKPVVNTLLASLRNQSDLNKAFKTPSVHERFMDDFFFAYGYGDVNEVFNPASAYKRYTLLKRETGLSYLGDVAYTADARIGAIRAHIAAFGTATPIPTTAEPPTLIGAFAKNSFLQLTKLAAGIQTAYADASRYPMMAKALDTTVDVVKAQAAKVAEASKKSAAYEVLETSASEVAPVAAVITGAISGYATQGSYGAVEGAMKALGSFVPVIGTIIDIGVKVANSYVEAQAKYDNDQCKAMQDNILGLYKTTLDLQLPVPWHALSQWSIACATTAYGAAHSYHDTDDQEALLHIFQTNYDRLNALSNEYKLLVSRWWLTAQLFMSDPKVRVVFDALGYSSFSYASDEQVMLIAAPIAASEGLDIDDFAKRLWVVSPGWRAASPSLMQKEEVTHSEFTSDCESADTCVKTVRTGVFYVSNAATLQWAILAKDAFDLADQLKGRKPPTSLMGDPKTLNKVTVTVAPRPVDGPKVTGFDRA